MRTEFKIFLTGLLFMMAPAVFGQQKVETGSGVGKKELTAKRFEAKRAKTTKGDFKSKPVVREVVRTRELKEAEKE